MLKDHCLGSSQGFGAQNKNILKFLMLRRVKQAMQVHLVWAELQNVRVGNVFGLNKDAIKVIKKVWEAADIVMFRDFFCLRVLAILSVDFCC